MRRRPLIAILTALALASTACGNGGGGAASGGAGAQAAAAPAVVKITLSDFKIEPAAIQVVSGRPVTFDIANQGPSPHTFAIDAPGKTYDSGQIAPGSSATLDVPALAAGSYQAYCSIPGHKEAGMVATVTASATGAAAGGTILAGSGSGSGTEMAGMNGMDGSMPPMSAQQMADMHKAGVDAFLAGDQTSTQGGQPLKPTLDHGVKVFALTAQAVRWEVSKGVFVDAMAYNGQIPGPEIRVNPGDRIRVVLQNQLTQPTTVHFHGMTVPNADDGVPYVTQDPVMPGQYWAYGFTVKDPPGMYVYHSHFNSTEQVGAGLYGALIVEPEGGWRYRSAEVDPRSGQLRYGATPKIDDEYTMFLGDGTLGYVINGKSFPATTPLTAKKADWVLIHLANDGSLLHPMHMHGYHFEVIAQDGFPLADPYMADTLVVAPGQRYDVLVHAIHPGAWAFHCHILPHVEGPQGMYGMVTALVVQ